MKKQKLLITFLSCMFVMLLASCCWGVSDIFFDTKSPLPDGKVGEPYEVKIDISTIGTIEYPFTWTSGNLPPGLSFHGNHYWIDKGGTISGIPEEAGEFRLWLNVRDFDLNAFKTEYYSITILPSDSEPAPEPVVGIELKAENFPDANFLNFVKNSYDTDNDSFLSESEISKVTVINVSGMRISSLKGIEFFRYLTFLNCSLNALRTLDVSKNIDLTFLNCDLNGIIELDLSKNVALEILHCSGTLLKTLDVSKNTNLRTLTCSANNFIVLNLENNSALSQLICNDTHLTELDVSKNLNLEYLWCYNNNLTELDVTKNLKLLVLECQNNKIAALDTSNNTKLVQFNCSNNNLTELDVRKNIELSFLKLNNNKITALDVSNNRKLSGIHCYSNQLTQLDVSNNSLYFFGSDNKKDPDYYPLLTSKQKPKGLQFKKLGNTYSVNLKDYLSDKISRIKSGSVKGYSSGKKITTKYNSSTGIATFETLPEYVYYEFDTGWNEESYMFEKYMKVYFYVALNITSSFSKNGVIKNSYIGEAEVLGGKLPYTWSKSGKIPSGLTLTYSETKATLSGTPTKAGTYNFTLKVKDKNGSITSNDYTITITKPELTGTVKDTTVNASYSRTFKVSGGTEPYTWSKSGTLPKGLTLEGSNTKATISGTPTKAGSYTFKIIAKDANGASVSQSFTVNVTKTTLEGSVSHGIVKAKYSKVFNVSGGAKPYTWTISGDIPSGLTLKGSNTKATISGTPKASGTYKFKIIVKDANGASASKSCTIKITQTTMSGSVSNGIVKAEYSKTLKVSGGTEPYTWSKSGTLPKGLTLEGSNTQAKISGIPTKAGSYNFKVTAKDANGVSASKSFTIDVTKTTIDGTLNDGVIKTKYSGTLKASGGTKPYTWSTSGTLPTGLTFKGANTKATISGTPKTAGSYKFKVTLEDSNGAAMSKSFTIKIAAANSKASKDESSNEIEDENISTYEIFDNSVENENDENDFSSSIFRTSLEIVSEDILSKGEGKDEDIVDVKANSPVTFKLGEWKYANGTKAEISDAIVYIDDNATEISISDEGLFTIPAEFVKDDFKVSVEAQNGELESEELFISAIE